MNENFMGGQIYKENSPFGTPHPNSELGRRGTPEQYKAFAQWLNDKTGGSAYRAGGIDINPDVMKYVVNYLGDGALRFGTDKAPGLGSALMGNGRREVWRMNCLYLKAFLDLNYRGSKWRRVGIRSKVGIANNMT